MILLEGVNLTDAQMNQCFDKIAANESCSEFIIKAGFGDFWILKTPNGKTYVGHKQQIVDLRSHQFRR